LDGSNPAAMAGRSYHLRIAPASDSIRSSELKASTRSASQRRRNASRPAPIDETNGNENEEGRAHTDIYQRNHSERRTRNCRRKPPPGSGEKNQAREGKPRKGVCSILQFLGGGVGFLYLYKARSLDFFFSANLPFSPGAMERKRSTARRGFFFLLSHFSFPGRGEGGRGEWQWESYLTLFKTCTRAHHHQF
jgi:hypothetical protein